jgi:hypothetical protein
MGLKLLLAAGQRVDGRGRVASPALHGQQWGTSTWTFHAAFCCGWFLWMVLVDAGQATIGKNQRHGAKMSSSYRKAGLACTKTNEAHCEISI